MNRAGQVSDRKLSHPPVLCGTVSDGLPLEVPNRIWPTTGEGLDVIPPKTGTGASTRRPVGLSSPARLRERAHVGGTAWQVSAAMRKSNHPMLTVKRRNRRALPELAFSF